MRLFTARVIDNQQIMPSTYVLSLAAGSAAHTAVPGQFLHIRCQDNDAPLLRRPMSIFRTDGDTIQLMIRDVGEGSHLLTSRQPGDELDCLGPLGHGFHLDPNASNLLMVGGGYGVAPLVGLSERAIAHGANVALAVGAASAPFIFPATMLPPEVEYLVATDDGSAGYCGVVTELVSERLGWADTIYACGPLPMMAALSRILVNAGSRKPAYVAMEEHMGCGMGVCLGCAIETRRGSLRVCTEGPVFRIQDVVWRDE